MKLFRLSFSSFSLKLFARNQILISSARNHLHNMVMVYVALAQSLKYGNTRNMDGFDSDVLKLLFGRGVSVCRQIKTGGKLFPDCTSTINQVESTF